MKSRLQLLKTLKYILDEGSENSPVGYSEIIDFLFSKGMCPTKNTLTGDIKIIKEAGFNLITEKVGKFQKYYIPSEHFDTTEARLLIDSVISAKFVTPNKVATIINKVLRLTDSEMLLQYMKDIVVDNRQKHKNCYTYYSINVIQDALARGKRLNFRYFDLDENKNRVYRHNSKVYEVCPITMINGMDNYYLIAYDPHSGCGREKTFRIDRMVETVISKKNIGKIPVDRNECIKRYRSSVFSMYSGM